MMAKARITSEPDRVAGTGALEAMYRAQYAGMVCLAFTLVDSSAEAD
jgi:hypothetical protein